MKKVKNPNLPNRWLILILGGFTNAIVVALQSMSLSVLLPEIIVDFELTVTQSGLLWGIASFPTIISSLFAGTLIDRFGGKRILIASCILMGFTGAMRGFSPNYPILLITVIVFGFFAPFINISNIKNTSEWFKKQELGVANGILALGMALGFFIGSMISASYVSPLVGGWRNTFLIYGFSAIVIAIPWFFTPADSKGKGTSEVNTSKESAWEKIKYVVRIKNVLLLGLTIFCINGSVQGFLGYIPLYLRNLGWEVSTADSLAASFHLASMLFVIPLTLLSDKTGTRKKILLPITLLITLGIGLFAILTGGLLWVAVLLAGFGRDGMMAILFTMTLETEGVSENFAGTASSFMVIFASIGSLLSPPIGNTFVNLAAYFPFIFWAALCFVGVTCILSIKEKKLQISD